MGTKIARSPSTAPINCQPVLAANASGIAFGGAASERRTRMLDGRDFKNTLLCKIFVTAGRVAGSYTFETCLFSISYAFTTLPARGIRVANPGTPSALIRRLRMNRKSVIVFVSLIAIALGTVACGSSSPSAPTQLSGSPSAPTTGNRATIDGSITGAALSALTLTGGSFASLTGPGMTVTVVGTDITAPVNPNGTFTLTNVPSGDIELRFTGTGTDALLTVTGVNGGDELRITVEVSGSTATLKNLTRKDKLNKVEIEGAIMSGTCESFVVNATTITTDAATQFSKGSCSNVVTGALVQVKGSTLTDGTVRATEVKFKAEEEDDVEDGEGEGKNKLQLEGTVMAGACGSFTVKNVAVTTDAATVFKNGRCEEILPGVRVHVKATPTGVATALATEVNIQRDDDDNGKSGDKDGSGGNSGSNNRGRN
jgi:hypothetical protein